MILDQIITTCTLTMKPCKGRPSYVVFTVDRFQEVEFQVKLKIIELKKNKQYRRRKFLSYTIPL